ncbi:transmembrane protein [Legionella santicrucis]|uniref:Transmembrane protein n=1 Tax=Legionella santicrucis TaxID=45074 RepID=A0A0W0Y9E8_9GAMM|nr:DUF5336 domain-containing protein [Legionella santicrucis]KTD53579.1 transmembrane protein [Legionella santicrucis]
MPIKDSKPNKIISPPPLGSPIIQKIYPQELVFEIPKAKESFFKKHKKAIIAVSATVLAAAIVGAVAFFAWPAVASVILGFGIYGLTLGALAGANLIAQVGLVAAVFAVGGFIAGGGLVTTGSKVINSISKAWNALYESPIDTQPNSISQLDPVPQSLKSIAETLSQIKGNIKNPPSLNSVVPSTDSGAFLAQLQQKKEKLKKWIEINKQLINVNPLSNEYKQLEAQANELEKDILSDRRAPLSQKNKQQVEEQPQRCFSNKSPDPASQSLKSIAETLSQIKGNIKNPPSLNSVAPSTASGAFLAQVQQKKEKLKKWTEINKQLINVNSLSNEYKQLEAQANELEKDILSDRRDPLGQKNKQQTEEQPQRCFSNKFKEAYCSTISTDDNSTPASSVHNN